MPASVALSLRDRLLGSGLQSPASKMKGERLGMSAGLALPRTCWYSSRACRSARRRCSPDPKASDALGESSCVGVQVHTPEHGACSPRLQGSSPWSLSTAKMSTMHQHCEHSLLTPGPFGPWEYCRVALLAPLAG